MSQRLGEALIAKGIIDRGQLERALDAQLIYGGHLGTCLVELGYVDVDTLASVLGEKFRINHVHRQRIESVEPEVLESLPVSLVQRHLAVPFAREEQTLHVAMVNPKNLLALDELSFASGCKVEAWIAPELLVHRAMERHYDLPRKLRHVPLSSQAPPPEPRRPVAPPQKLVREVERELTRLTEAQEAGVPSAAAEPAPAPQQAESAATASPPAAAPPQPTPAASPRVATATAPTPPPASAGSPARTAGTPDARPNAGAPRGSAAAFPRAGAERPAVEPLPQGPFIVQEPARIVAAAGPWRDPDSDDAPLRLEWVKRVKDGHQFWSELFEVPLDHSHFDGMTGVYVVWHQGHQPVLRVGQGSIRLRLMAERQDPELVDHHGRGPVYVTWAAVARAKRDGVVRYLSDMLCPQLLVTLPETPGVEVNLPR